MIIREHHGADKHSRAVYSDCERWRYTLTRRWADGPHANFVMLNPSTATELQNDPTVERCERRARALGFGTFTVTNIFAWRDTDPRALYRATDPIGEANDQAILEAARTADQVICAWGTHGAHMGRGAAVQTLLRGLGKPLHTLGITQAGHPKHPLYIGYAEGPKLWP
jgi:hypothetical protein